MWFKIQNQQVKFTILAKPNAKKTAILGIREQALHISIHAKPHQGAANEKLVAFLAALFKIPKSQITLLRGEGSRHKQVLVPLTDKVKAFIELQT